MIKKAKKTKVKKTTKKTTAKKATKKKTTTKKTTAKKTLKTTKKSAAKAKKKTTTKTATKKKTGRIKLKTRFRANVKKRIGRMPKLKKVRSRLAASIKIRKIRSKDVILVLDFGSQYTQLIARRIRENKVYSKIVPYNISAEEIQKLKPKGLVFSGGPLSVYDKGAPMPKKEILKLGIPILGICYGMQVLCEIFEGKVKNSKEREFGRAELFVDSSKDLFWKLTHQHYVLDESQ